MFDTIGRRVDPEARKRDALSVAITTLLCAAGVGFVTGWAAWTLGDATDLADLDDDGELVELVVLDPPEPLVAPAAPGPPARPERAAAARGESPAPQEPPPDPDAAPAPLLDEVPDEVASQAGHPDGTDEGEPDGDPQATGPGGGGGGGCAEEPCGPGVHVVHHTELDWRRKVEPRYPASAENTGLGEVVCLATVLIDDRGVPQRVIIADCPEAFHESTRRAMLRSRWYPPRVDGRRTEAQTTIRFRFVSGDEGD